LDGDVVGEPTHELPFNWNALYQFQPARIGQRHELVDGQQLWLGGDRHLGYS
jgi:hypothetical protein